MTMTAQEVQVEREKRASKRGGGNHDWFKASVGNTYIRIGPPWKTNGEVWKDVYYHGNYPEKVYCAQNDVDRKTGKHRKCAVCKRQADLKGDRSVRAKKLWGLLVKKNEGLWNILVAKVKKSSKGEYRVKGYEGKKFQILRLSSKWHNLLLDIFSDEDYRRKSILGVTHAKYGRLIRLNRVGEELDTTYTFKALDRETPIFDSSTKRKAVLKTLVDFDSMVSGSSDEELETFVHRSERLAKKMEHEEKKSGSSSSSESSGSSESESESSGGESSSGSGVSESEASEASAETDLEKQYRKMKHDVKSKHHKEHKHHGHEEEESESEASESSSS